MNSRSLFHKKGSVWLGSISRVFYFCTEIRSDNSNTFVGNRWYYLEEGVEINRSGHRTSDENGRRMVFERRPTVASSCATATNDDILCRVELVLASLAPSGPVPLSRACRRAMFTPIVFGPY